MEVIWIPSGEWALRSPLKTVLTRLGDIGNKSGGFQVFTVVDAGPNLCNPHKTITQLVISLSELSTIVCLGRRWQGHNLQKVIKGERERRRGRP